MRPDAGRPTSTRGRTISTVPWLGATLLAACLGACSSNGSDGTKTGATGDAGTGATGGTSSGAGGANSTGGTSGAASGGTSNGGTSSGGSSGSGAGGVAAGGAANVPDGGDAFPGDTFLPWFGGPSYYHWSKGPPSDPDFFPIAVWLQTPSNASRYAAVGVNLFVGLWEGPDENQLSTLAAAKMPVFCDQGGVWNAHLDDGTILGWLQPDEPDNAQPKAGGGYDPCIDPQTIIAGYDTMVGNDPNRPVWLGLGRGVSDTQWVGRGTCTGNTDMYEEYQKGGDILSFDIYPANGSIGLEAVPAGVENLRRWSGDAKPVVADIEGSMIDDGNPRPTPAQIESEIWMAIVHGAAGIQYFCHRFTPTFSETDCIDTTERADALTAIDAKVTGLAPVLNTRSVGNGVTARSSVADKPIDTMLKRYAGKTYLFATEMRSGTTHGTFTLRDFPASATAIVVGENRSIPVTGGVFEDDFADYGVHVYEIGIQ